MPRPLIKLEQLVCDTPTIPITRMFYNDGKGFMSPIGSLEFKKKLGSALLPDDPFSLGTGRATSDNYNVRSRNIGNITPSEMRAYHNLCNGLAKMGDSTLFGNKNNAIIHEPLDQSGLSVDYHHHDNFFTAPMGSETGFGGYMNENIGGTPAFKKTMNSGVTDFGFSKGVDLKVNSEWLAKSGSKFEEQKFDSLLNSFNNSDLFGKKFIKNNSLLSSLSK